MRLLSMSNEDLQAKYIEESGTTRHTSDCATSCAPAERPGPCDCKSAIAALDLAASVRGN